MSSGDENYSKTNNKKDKKSFGQKAKLSAEKREIKRNPDANNPNRNPFEKENEVAPPALLVERKDKKDSKHWNDKFIQQEIQEEEDAMRDAYEERNAYAYEEVDLEEDNGPPPIDQEELDRINEFCFQAAMELRSRNDQELRDFVLKKQMEELFYANTTFLDEDDTCEAMKLRRSHQIIDLKAENRLKRETVYHLTRQIEASERLINQLMMEDERAYVSASCDYFVDLEVDDLVPPLTVEELVEEDS
jgi:hypothetical protein